MRWTRIARATAAGALFLVCSTGRAQVGPSAETPAAAPASGPPATIEADAQAARPTPPAAAAEAPTTYGGSAPGEAAPTASTGFVEEIVEDVATPTRRVVRWRTRTPTATPSSTPTVTATHTSTVIPTRAPAAAAPAGAPNQARSPRHEDRPRAPTRAREVVPLAAAPAAQAPASPSPIGFLLSGALVGLVAAALGYAAARLAQPSHRRQARDALATAILAELRWLDALLRTIVEHGASQTDYPVDHPIIEAGLRDLTLFEPETAARLAHFHDLLRSLRYEMMQLRDNPRRWTGRMAEFDRLLKARAAMACRAVPDLIKALERDGGQPPPPLADRSLATGSIEVPPTPFARGEGEDWTL